MIVIEIKWERDWFPQVPRLYWRSMENRRKFLDEIAIKHNVKKLSDWGKVTISQIRQFGGAGLLKYYNNSLFECLKAIYKGIFIIEEKIKTKKISNGKESGFQIFLVSQKSIGILWKIAGSLWTVLHYTPM